MIRAISIKHRIRRTILLYLILFCLQKVNSSPHFAGAMKNPNFSSLEEAGVQGQSPCRKQVSAIE